MLRLPPPGQPCTCLRLAAGEYKAFISNNSCVVCPANFNMLVIMSNALEDCLCLQGYVASSDNDESCAPCPRNRFNYVLDCSSCLACPVTSGTEVPTSTSASCECEAGYTAGEDEDYPRYEKSSPSTCELCTMDVCCPTITTLFFVSARTNKRHHHHQNGHKAHVSLPRQGNTWKCRGY